MPEAHTTPAVSPVVCGSSSRSSGCSSSCSPACAAGSDATSANRLSTSEQHLIKGSLLSALGLPLLLLVMGALVGSTLTGEWYGVGSSTGSIIGGVAGLAGGILAHISRKPSTKSDY